MRTLPYKKSGFNFGYGGSDLKALGWIFLGFTNQSGTNIGTNKKKR